MKKFIALLSIIVCCCLLFGCQDASEPKKDYVVLSFDTGFELTIDPIVLDGKTEQSMPEDPMRAGYEFLGWYYDENFFIPFKTSDAITQDLTLYAKWRKKSGTEEQNPPPIEDPLGIKYVKEGEIYTVAGYVGDAESLVIPARYAGFPVMKIAASAFAGTKLKRISFGKNIATVESGAFRGALSLEYISVDSGNPKFSSSNGILYNDIFTAVIAVPCRLTEERLELRGINLIWEYAFENCTCEVTFGDGEYTVMEGLSFAGFKGRLVLGSAINEIRREAFKDATAAIDFSENGAITVLRNGAFADYKGVRVDVPACVTAIEMHAFAGCTATVDLSCAPLTDIGESAFAGYEGKSLEIPASVRKIGKNAFYRAKTSISFASGSLYERVESLAFAGFGGSDEKNNYSGTVVFPSTVTSVDKNAFYGSYSFVYFGAKESDMNLDKDAMAEFKGKCFFAE